MNKIIQVENLKFKYPQQENYALNDISFEIEEGEWIAIIGHNGSGKSTLSKAMDGLLAAESGVVTVDQKILEEDSLWEIRRKIGIVFQNPDNQFVGATVEDDVAFGLENNGVPREEMLALVKNALETVRMTEFATKEPARLSGGQKQRVAIAGMIALKPKVIILDESTSMLDPKGRQEVLETIRELKERENLTVISITHDIDEAAQANRVFVMEKGSLIQIGTPAEIFAQGEKLVDMGLDMPFPEKLKMELKNRQIDVPEEYLDEERMVDWLWKSVSNK